MRKTRGCFAGFAVVIIALTVQTRAQRSGTAQAPPADLVLINGRIVTMDDGRPEAEAIAISRDRVQALGSTADIRQTAGPGTQVIDLQGQLAIPGFIEITPMTQTEPSRYGRLTCADVTMLSVSITTKSAQTNIKLRFIIFLLFLFNLS